MSGWHHALRAAGLAGLAYFWLYLVANALILALAWREVRRQALHARLAPLRAANGFPGGGQPAGEGAGPAGAAPTAPAAPPGGSAHPGGGGARTDLVPPISLLVPAYNEQETVVEAVRSLLQSDYPLFEVVVINDGSRDATLERLKEAFALTPANRSPYQFVRTRPVRGVYASRVAPRLVVIDKENGGKADALNAGLNYARFPLVACLDADSVLEAQSLARAVRPFLQDPDTVASSGVVRVVNGCRVEGGRVVGVGLPREPLAVMQVLEYARAFFLVRLGLSRLGALPIISGAFGLFRRELVGRLGGFATDTVAEDMEMVMRLHAHLRRQGVPYRIASVADPVAWTEVPTTLAGLGRQRARWHRGLAQVLWRYRHLTLNPRYGALGLVVVPYLWLFELLAPVAEGLGLGLALAATLAGALPPAALAGALVLPAATSLVLTVAALWHEEVAFQRYHRMGDVVRVLAYCATDALWYRWLTLYWRLQGLRQALAGRQDWGHLARAGTWIAQSPTR